MMLTEPPEKSSGLQGRGRFFRPSYLGNGERSITEKVRFRNAPDKILPTAHPLRQRWHPSRCRDVRPKKPAVPHPCPNNSVLAWDVSCCWVWFSWGFETAIGGTLVLLVFLRLVVCWRKGVSLGLFLDLYFLKKKHLWPNVLRRSPERDWVRGTGSLSQPPPICMRPPLTQFTKM